MARYIIEEMPDLQKTGKRITAELIVASTSVPWSWEIISIRFLSVDRTRHR